MKVAMLPKSGMCCEGGTAKYLQDIIPGLLAKGHEITVYTTGLNAGLEQSYPEITHITIPSGHLSLDERLETAKRHVRHAITRNFDILHLHHPPTAFHIEEIHKAGKKVVVTHHGSQFIRPLTEDLRARTLYDDYKLMLRQADFVAVHSPHIFDSYSAAGMKNVHFMPIAVNLQSERVQLCDSRLESEKYLLFVGKLNKEKGVNLAIAAYKLLDTPFPLVIIGNGAFEKEYADSCKKSAGDNNNILFLGEQLGERRDALISNAYVYVNPLRIQGLPLSVLEAASYGRAIINSDNSNHHGIISECTHQFKTEDVSDLANAMQFLLNNPARVRELGVKAQTYAIENHLITRVVDAYDTAYRTI